MTYVMDKGYVDYNWWYKINEAKAKFITRLKANAAFKVVENMAIDEAHQALILADQVIHLTNKKPRAGAENLYAFRPLRLVTVYRENKKPLLLVSNDFTRTPEEITALYKQRWQIELFFKWIKQKLKLKSYFGRSENAVRIQIYSALITYLAMYLLQSGSHTWCSLSMVQIWLQHGLFVRDKTVESTYCRLKKRRKLIEKQQISLPLDFAEF